MGRHKFLIHGRPVPSFLHCSTLIRDLSPEQKWFSFITFDTVCVFDLSYRCYACTIGSWCKTEENMLKLLFCLCVSRHIIHKTQKFNTWTRRQEDREKQKKWSATLSVRSKNFSFKMFIHLVTEEAAFWLYLISSVCFVVDYVYSSAERWSQLWLQPSSGTLLFNQQQKKATTIPVCSPEVFWSTTRFTEKMADTVVINMKHVLCMLIKYAKTSSRLLILFHSRLLLFLSF